MSGYDYYALTLANTTRENPAGIARHKDGSFEVYQDGKWVEKQELAAIHVGEFNDYEDVSEEEANKIIARQ